MKILPYIVALLLVAGALFGAYHHGETVANDDWQARWSERDARDEAAKAANEAAERDKEQSRQQASASSFPSAAPASRLRPSRG